jgi:hypothetical protein
LWRVVVVTGSCWVAVEVDTVLVEVYTVLVVVPS